MGKRKVAVKESVSVSISKIAWFIESKGLITTAEKFSDSVYDFLEKLGDNRKSYRLCRDPRRSSLGWKRIQYKKKYSIAFIESESD